MEEKTISATPLLLPPQKRVSRVHECRHCSLAMTVAPCLPLVPKYWEDIPEIVPEPEIYRSLTHHLGCRGVQRQCKLNCVADMKETQPRRNPWAILLRRAVSRADKLAKEKRFEKVMAQRKKALSAQKKLAKLAGPASRASGRAGDPHNHSEFLSSLDWDGDDNELSVSVLAPMNEWNDERYQESVLHRLQSMRRERDSKNERKRMRPVLKQRTSRSTRGQQPQHQRYSRATAAASSVPLSSTAAASPFSTAANWMKYWFSSSSPRESVVGEPRTSRKSFFNILRRF